MSNTKDEKDQERGDEVLKRMLKTPPEPKGKGDSLRRRLPVLDQDTNNGGDAKKA